VPHTSSPDADARTRLLETAYSLFSVYGIHAVGVDRIIAEAGVAKMTLYRHFASKNDLVLAFLELREQRWTRDWLEAGLVQRSAIPRERLLALFDLLDDWFQRADFESCSFLRTLLEVPDESDPVHRAAVRHLETVRAVLAGFAEEASLSRPEQAAIQLQILMMGAIMSATRGDRDAARRARGVADGFLQTTA
jgi:AcrR family transcriptional regulator